MQVNHPSTTRGFNPQPDPPGQVSPKPPESSAARQSCWDPRAPGHVDPSRIHDSRIWMPGNPTPGPLLPGQSGNGTMARSILGTIWDGFVDWVKGKWNEVVDLAQGLYEDFRDLVRHAVDWISGPTA